MAFFASPGPDRDTRSLARSASTSGSASAKSKAPVASSSTVGERVGAVRGARPPPTRPPRGPASTEFGIISSVSSVSGSASTSMESLGAELADVRMALQVYGGSDDGHPHSRSHSLSPVGLSVKDASASSLKTSLRAPDHGSRHSSRSPHGSRRKTSTPTSVQTGSASLAAPVSATGANPLAHTRSSPDLPQRVQGEKNRARPLLRTRTTSAATTSAVIPDSNNGTVPPRPPRGPRPPVVTSPTKSTSFPAVEASNTPVRAASESATTATSSRTPFNTIDLNPSHAFASSSVSSPQPGPSGSAYSHMQQDQHQQYTLNSISGKHQIQFDVYETDHTRAYTPTRGLAPPPRGGYKSSGSASDGSYGSPLSELGGAFSVKRLLSKPASPSASVSMSAASSSGYASPTPGVRSEPDIDLRRWGSATGQRSGMGQGALSDPEAIPPFALSTTTSSTSAAAALGSLGRARGREWGHVLSARGHTRTGSSSLDGPGEGANVPYPIGARVAGVNASVGLNIGERPRIQLTTAAVRRLSALGAGVSGSSNPLDVREAAAAAAAIESGPASAPPIVRPRASNSQPTMSSIRMTSTASTPTGASSGGSGAKGTRMREDSPPPPGLTPAEIVAHAYKQQEKRRAALAREAVRTGGEVETVRVSKEKEKRAKRERERERSTRTTSVDDTRGPVTSPESSRVLGAGDDDEALGPYYTVLGNPGGRVVAIGSARDSAFGLFDGPGPRMGTRGRVAAQAIVAELAASTNVPTHANGGTPSPSETERGGSSGKHLDKEKEKEKEKDHGDGHRAQGQGTIRRKLTKKMSGPLRGRQEGSLARGTSKDMAVGEWGEVVVVGSGKGSDESEKTRMMRPSLSLNTNTSSSAVLPTSTVSGSAGSSTISSGLVAAEGRRSVTLPREKNGAIARLRGISPSKASFDSYVDLGGSTSGSVSISGHGRPSAVNGVAPWLAGERERVRVMSDLSARGRPEKQSCELGSAKGKDRIGERERDRDKENGGKFWGLVKRISSNALKDRYRERHDSETAVPPPVPVLSTAQSPTPAIATRFDFEKLDDEERVEKDDEETVGAALGLGLGIGMGIGFGFGSGLSSTPKSATSKKSGRPSTAPTLLNNGASSGLRFPQRQASSPLAPLDTQTSLQQQQQRPSTATRSSSPTLSSDPPSWDSFNRTQSSRSSASSYADDNMALPSAISNDTKQQSSPLGQYILAPEKFSMFDSPGMPEDDKRDENERERGRTERRVTPGSFSLDFGNVTHDPLFYDEENAPQQALPVPPRRAANTGRHMPHRGANDSSRSASPSIPTFSADNAINTFGPGARGRSATNATATTEPASSSALADNDFGSTTTASDSVPLTPLPPPRPPRSALRTPQLPALPSTPQTTKSSSSGSSHSGGAAPNPGRSSIGGYSQASTARPASGTSFTPGAPSPGPSPASSSTPSLLPGDAQSPVSASSDARTSSSGGSGSASASPTSARGPGPRGGIFGGLKLGGGLTSPAGKCGAKPDADGGARPLTEKEKIDKWDELLDRSERAGGTLHVGLGGLLSDQMRESVYESVRGSIYEDY